MRFMTAPVRQSLSAAFGEPDGPSMDPHEELSVTESRDFVVDQLNIMMLQEKAYSVSFRDLEIYFKRAHVHPATVAANSNTIAFPSPAREPLSCIDCLSGRKKMCEWAYEVVDYFEYDREVVTVAFNFVDRYTLEVLKNGDEVLDRDLFQTICITSLYIAMKLQGPIYVMEQSQPQTMAAIVSIRTFVQISRGLVTVESLEEMEVKMSSCLKYRLNPPTPGLFTAYLILFLAPDNARQVNPFLNFEPLLEEEMVNIFEVARYQTELSTFDARLTMTCQPSCVSAAAILNAMTYLRSRAGGVSIPENLLDAFQSIMLQILPDADGDTLNKARDVLETICPSESLDRWSGFTVHAMEKTSDDRENKLRNEESLTLSPYSVDTRHFHEI